MSQARCALVTGGAGFIGSHLVEGLLSEGWRVRVLDDFSSGCEENLAGSAERVELLRGSILDSGLLERALRGVEVVFHLAAVPSVPSSVADPIGTNAVNVDGTLAVLEGARRATARRLVFAASCAIYGDDPTLPKSEDLPPRPLSPYALQKLTGERYCQLFTSLYGLEAVTLRYFNVFGPRQDPQSEYAAVIPKFVSACLAGEAPTIFGDGEQTRDFVYVGDVVRANLLAADAAGAPGHVCNVASGRRISLNELYREIAKLTGCAAQPAYVQARPGDVRDSLASLHCAEALLGYRPGFGLRQGLEQTVSFFRQRPECCQ